MMTAESTLRERFAEAELACMGAGFIPTARRVHNHPPYRPVCNERTVDGQLRGACLNDDGSER